MAGKDRAPLKVLLGADQRLNTAYMLKTACLLKASFGRLRDDHSPP